MQCLGHKLHLTVCNALCLWVKESEASELSPGGEKSNETDGHVNTDLDDSNNLHDEYQK